MKHFKIDFSSLWYLRNALICQWFEHGSWMNVQEGGYGKIWFSKKKVLCKLENVSKKTYHHINVDQEN